jgi:hypothetical protein
VGRVALGTALLPTCFGLAALGCGSKHASNEAPLAKDNPAASPDEPPIVLSKTAKLAALRMETPIYEKPDRGSKRLGYLRLGAKVARTDKPMPGADCVGDWYGIDHSGFVCAGTAPPSEKTANKTSDVADATTELDHKLIRALGRVPDLSKPMPYPYGFLRANSALYNQLPNKKDQEKFEFAVRGHRRAYAKNAKVWNEVEHGGANAVPLDEHGAALTPPEAPYPPPPAASTPESELFGGGDSDATPWWLAPSPKSTRRDRWDRGIPNVSSFVVPPYAILAGRTFRHAGVALIGNFMSDERGDHRRFAVTVDGRLVPTDKLKPHFASAFHGVVIDGQKVRMPFAFVREKHAHYYEASDKTSRWAETDEAPYRSAVNLTGKVKRFPTVRYAETTDGRWLGVKDIAYVDRPSEPPREFEYAKTKWVDVSIWQQTLVAYEGERPVYATLVSTGIDGMGDPKTTKSTLRGAFRIDSKHVTATMDADDIESRFELRDVPWVQFFERSYAVHATYWHDDFGRPRSHGCVNLAPIDARWLFFWTDPGLPAGWHSVTSHAKTGTGTWVRVRG